MSREKSKWAAAADAASRGDDPQWMHDDRANNSQFLQEETKRLQGKSVQSSRRALGRLNDATDMAADNLNRMNQQSEQLYKMEHTLEETKHTAKVNEQKVSALKSLNKFFLLPAFGVNKAKRAEEKLKFEQEEQISRGKNAKERDESYSKRQDRLASYNFDGNGKKGASQKFNSTPNGLERDKGENEIDSNLNQISSGLSRLKMMAHAMDDELDEQNEQINRIKDRTDKTGGHVKHLNNKFDESGLLRKGKR